MFTFDNLVAQADESRTDSFEKSKRKPNSPNSGPSVSEHTKWVAHAILSRKMPSARSYNSKTCELILT